MERITVWRPQISSHEYYAKWALDRYRPCEKCSDEYREAYERLAGLLDAAEICFQKAYPIYAELSRLELLESGFHE